MIELFNMIAYYVGAFMVGSVIVAFVLAITLILLALFLKLVGFFYEIGREWIIHWRQRDRWIDKP